MAPPRSRRVPTVWLAAMMLAGATAASAAPTITALRPVVRLPSGAQEGLSELLLQATGPDVTAARVREVLANRDLAQAAPVSEETEPSADRLVFQIAQVSSTVWTAVIVLTWAIGLFVLVLNNPAFGAEFFLGLSFGFGNFFLAGGAHIGHELKPANGFNLHDKPDDDLKAVPLHTPWTPGIAVAVSYRIPLK